MSLIKANQKKSKELVPKENGKPFNILIRHEKLVEFDNLSLMWPHGVVMQVLNWLQSCEKQEVKEN